jgi:hypothetical protein
LLVTAGALCGVAAGLLIISDAVRRSVGVVPGRMPWVLILCLLGLFANLALAGKVVMRLVRRRPPAVPATAAPGVARDAPAARAGGDPAAAPIGRGRRPGGP